MKRIALISIALGVMIVDGVAYGLWTDRWGSAQAVEEAVARLERVPMALGDWQGDSRELGARQAEQAGYAGYWLRRYERRKDGMVINVMLACGRPGPLSVHTPSVCYAGAGYTEEEAPVKHVVGDPPAELWRSKFSKAGATIPVYQRVYWSWHASGAWKAAQNPRLQFAGQPVLYKMYVTHAMTGGDEKLEDAACAEFMNLLIPELEKNLARLR